MQTEEERARVLAQSSPVREFRVSSIRRYQVTDWTDYRGGSGTRVLADDLTMVQANELATAFGAANPGSLVNMIEPPFEGSWEAVPKSALDIQGTHPPTRYFLDCEFDGLGGDLISMALVSERGPSLYLVFDGYEDASDPWVIENVLPIVPLPIAKYVTREQAQHELSLFLAADPSPVIVTDWPDDVSYLASLMLTGPGTMINIPRVTFEVHRVDAYPTKLAGAVQHNAWWDAKALQHLLAT